MTGEHAAPRAELADGIIRPSSAEELTECLRELRSTNARISVQGGATHEPMTNIGEPADVAVDTTGLNRIIEYSPRDLTLAAEAGCTIQQLSDLLASEGQRLVLDVAHTDRATIGGVFATGLSGPRRLRYGALKDSVLGTEIVTVDGQLTKSGGMVVKNVSGYDLSRLHYGSLGVFGIVVRVNLKVLPTAPAARLVTATFSGAPAAWEAIGAARNASLETTSIIAIRSADDTWSIQVRFEGSDNMTQTQARRCADLVSGVGTSLDVVVEAIDPHCVGDFERFVDLRSGEAIARLAAPFSQQPEIVANALRTGAKSVCADPGSGLVYVIADPTPEWRDAMRRLFRRSTFLSLPANLKRGLDVTGGVDEPVAAILSRLKGGFDPQGRLQPGRGVLGL